MAMGSGSIVGGTLRVLDPETVDRFRALYLEDRLDLEDATALRRHLTTERWMELQREKFAIDAKRAGEVVSITAGRTDKQIAEEIRADLQARLEAIGEIMTKARREHGMVVAFQFAPPDGFGRQNLAVLEITKKLC